MVERAITDGLVLLKAAPTGDLTAEVTTLTGWTDMSPKALTYNINETRGNAGVRPHGANPRTRQLPGAITGTIALTFLNDAGGDPDPESFLEAIHSADGRLQYVIQDDREALATGALGVIEPVASSGNPQRAGSAIINSIDYFGPGDGTASIVSVSCDMDRDYARRV